MKTRQILSMVLLAASMQVHAEEEPIKYGDFESWITRSIKESALLGGNTKTLYEPGPKGTYDGARPYTNQGGCPWATSNVYAKVCGVVKTNSSVYPEKHGNGKCAKLCTQYVKCKAIGVVNISVLAAGSLYLGSIEEPVTSTSNPMTKINVGIPFTRRPKAVKFDYNYQGTGENTRIRETGFSKTKTIDGPDNAEMVCLLQKRWEEPDGSIHALRIGTHRVRFNKNTDGWVEGKEFPIHYGDISKESWYRDYMGFVVGERAYYAKNSKGENVKIIEEGWADADEKPTHLILKFDSSNGGPYIGSIGNTLMIDNVKLVY